MTNTTTQASRRRILVTDGNEVRTAHGGLEAVAVATEFRPDVILLDISLLKLTVSACSACSRRRAPR